MSTPSHNLSAERITCADLAAPVVKRAAGGGAILLALSVLLGWLRGDEMSRFFHSYLVAVTFFTTIALGALFFVLLQHLVRARWSVVVRRLAEILTATFPLLGALLALGVLIPMLLGADSLYLWSTAEAKGDHLLQGKAGWLNVPFFAVRCLVYFTVWTLISRHFFASSVAQDASSDPAISEKLRVASAPALVGFAFTTAFAAFDLLMSLDPHWYSTMYGVYFFAGAAVAIFATLALAGLLLQSRARLLGVITVEHYHDIGKLLFAFIFFWGYIAFSQFMLIWYADLPEETSWLHHRMFTSWKWLSLLLLVGHFCLPFLFLLTRETKRRLPVLAGFSVWMLAMHYCDLFWLVMPEQEQAGLSLALVDITTLFAVGGLFVAVAARAAGRVNLLAIGDPHLGESLDFENY